MSFDAILDAHQLQDPALRLLAEIVRAADSHPSCPHRAGEGLRWIAHGFSELGLTDHERLEREFPLYDALRGMPAADTAGRMKVPVRVCMMFAVMAWAARDRHVIDFNRDRTGVLPPDWESAMTKTGGEPDWQILNDDTAPCKPNVLAQLSKDRTAGRFPVAVYRGANFKDGEAGVRFKPVSGVVDQAAGLVWRYQDRNNYYIVRANALESNVVLYKVQNGERTSLAPRGLPSRGYGVKHAVPKMVWSELKVAFSGPLATVYFNDEKLFDVEDATFTGAGRIGVWTKADSVTYFDDFTFTPR